VSVIKNSSKHRFERAKYDAHCILDARAHHAIRSLEEK
jgi:hypothetical protein